MSEVQQEEWFSALKQELETAYLQHDEPWKQSGFSGPEERWVECRKPIADCIDKPGSFLDIGCANGYLLECIIKWTAERGITVVPYGIDLSEKLIKLAQERLPVYSRNFHEANGLYWDSPVTFDFVRTELGYVPDDIRQEYLDRIIDRYLLPRGRLLVADYRSRSTPVDEPWLDITLQEWGYNITARKSGSYDNRELVRVYVIEKPGEK